MFYHCARYQFDFPGSNEPGVAGGIVAASAVPRMALLRRQRRLDKDYPWLVHRLLDPQLYLANLPNTARHVPNLATYPWFGASMPEYDTHEHKIVADWMASHEKHLRSAWERKVLHPTNAASTAIDIQVRFGVEGIILPAPLTTITTDGFQSELEYIDAGISYARLRNIKKPIYATIAVSDSILRGSSPLENSLLSTISDQVAARQELTGAYIVIEQSSETGHCCRCEEACVALLVLVDDLHQGAGKRVIINYGGMFGLLCMAAGADIWASGHYRSQRRFKLADEDEDGGGAFPRFYSPRMLGDIGLADNVDLAFHSDLRRWLFKPETHASRPLLSALADGSKVKDVLEWRYTQQNLAEAAKHYYEICVLADAFLRDLPPHTRMRAVEHWLGKAVDLAARLSAIQGFKKGSHTDIGHQDVWLNAFTKWRNRKR